MILDQNLVREDGLGNTEGWFSTYPAVVEVVEGGEGFTASFQDRLILLSPMNEGDFECSG